MKKPVIVFDLDGTLVDTAPDLLDSLNHCLTLAGLEPVAESGFRRFVGHGARVMIERAYAARSRPLPKEELDRMFSAFISHYGDNMPGRSQPYPGVLAAMDRFAAKGFPIAICTNKLEQLANRLIGSLELTERFEAITGADTFAWRKPDPRHLTATIEMAGGDPAHGLMIGDSQTDIDTAKAAGIPVVAVDFGYTDTHVSAFGPSRVISHFDELTLDMTEALLAAGTR